VSSVAGSDHSLVKDVTTPWGAKVSYIYKTSRTGNSVCGNWINGSNTDGVYQRKVTIGAEQYNYEYSDYAGSVGALTTWVTEVKEPNAVKKYHHACYNSQTLPESAVEHAKAMALVRQDVLGSSGTLLRRTDSTWQTIAYSGPVRRQRTVDTTVSTLRLYKQKEVITEDSGTYTTEWLAPDIYGLPATVLKSSNQLTDKLYTRQTYTHFPTLWLIGLPGTLELSADGVSWVTKEETSYYGVNHSAQAKPYQVKLYGNLQKTYASYHPDGLIKRINYNEGSQRWLQLDDYKFGQPQRIKVPQRYSTSCTNPDTCFSLIQQTINDDGWLSKFTDLNQNCTNYTYDSLGRLRSSSPCDNRWAATTFDYATEENSTVLTETRGGYKRQSTFDGLMREVLTKEWDITSPAESRIIRRTFDDSNNLVFASYPSDNETETQGTVYQYDALQRKTSEYDTVSQKGNSWSYQYGNKLIETDANNYVTTTTFKALGRPDYSLPTRVEQPEGAVTSISYTLFDAMNSVQQGSITELRRYNARQQLCLVKRPDTGLTIYTYNNLGQILSSAEGLSGNGTVCSDYTNQSTARINHSYDNLGALKSITYADGSPGKVFTLDRQGNLTKLSAGTAVWDYSYNSLNLVESEILTVDNQSWLLDPSYNSLGHQISLLYPSGESVDYAPNALGQPTKAGTYATNAKYYPNGQLKNFNYGNGLLFTQALDARKRPSELLVKKGTSVRVGQSYGYDDRNNITAITDQTNPANNIGLGYDGLERLVTASGYWGAGSVSYDVLGNIKSKTLGTQALTYNYNNSTNRLTSVTGGYSFCYDGRGTVTNNGKRNFSVNRANQMTSSGAISYVYDGHNRRVKKVNGAGTQYSFYSQSGQFLSTTGSQGPTEFIYLGSKLVAQVSQVSTTDDKPGYTGHLEDKDIGLTYMQQRYYDPVIGRFYSNDPVGFTPSNPMMFNRYAYANNNPYKYIDPDGRAPDVVVDAAFTIYDAGQTLGAAAAYVEGVVTGNEALTAVAGEGLASSATNLAISAVSMAVPGASAPMLRTASQVKTEVKVLKNGEKQVTSKDTKTSFANKLESRGYEKGTNAKGDAHYTKGDVKYTLKSYPGDKKDTAYRNAGDRQTHKIRLQKDE
jgi:RHS repeat-associated protein